MKPLLICMTPVRNEAWILHAFLKTTSLWADYIIIADQMSTDGSREIALSYPKVVLIDNNNPVYDEASRQKLLIDRARVIEGDKILFGLDADEIFAANFTETNDWKKILNSKPGDVFWFKWAEICPDQKNYWESETTYYPWMFHDDGIEPHGNYVRNMHSMRIPYPIHEKQMYYINDFKVLHLAYLNSFRVNAKRRFYKFVDWSLNNRSIIKLSRSYAQKKTDPVYPASNNMLDFEKYFGLNLFDNIDISSKEFWFDSYIVERLNNYPNTKINKLDIWEVDFVKTHQLKDKRNLIIKMVHSYLKYTQTIKNNKLIRLIDKVLSILL